MHGIHFLKKRLDFFVRSNKNAWYGIMVAGKVFRTVRLTQVHLRLLLERLTLLVATVQAALALVK